MNTLNHLEPTPVWQQFQQLCNRPHPSRKEQAVVEYVLTVAAEYGLEAELDEVGNVLVRKPATAGMEDRRGVILQSHLDMVPQKNADSSHNFAEDPITTIIDGDWVTADGTTLGADNGIGCAAMLAVLMSKDIPHGPLEALFTINEEAGMTGALGLRPNWLLGDILLNLDTEEEAELYVGCAGGINVNITLPYSSEVVSNDQIAFELNIGGLKGGHSGVDIHLGLGNANKLANRLLSEALQRFDLGVYSFDGGTLNNAIPRESFTGITLPGSQVDGFKTFITDFEATLKAELGALEPNVNVSLTPQTLPASQIDRETLQAFIKAVDACPNGPVGMIAELPDVVETSNNIGLIFSDDANLYVQCLTRSSQESCRDELVASIKAAFESAGADVKTSGAYPGWQPEMNSPLLNMMSDQHQILFGKKPAIKVIHAGLECGVLGAIYPNWEMISMGPTIRGAHSPDERVHIPAVASFWQWLLAALVAVPAR